MLREDLKSRPVFLDGLLCQIYSVVRIPRLDLRDNGLRLPLMACVRQIMGGLDDLMICMCQFNMLYVNIPLIARVFVVKAQNGTNPRPMRLGSSATQQVQQITRLRS